MAGRKVYSHARTGVAVDHLDGTAMSLDDFADDGQTEAASSVVGGSYFVEPDEAFEDGQSISGVDACAIVGDIDEEASFGAADRELNFRGGVSGGVVEQVAERSTELLWVALDRQTIRSTIGSD